METFRIKAVPGETSCTLVMTGEVDLAVTPDLVELGTISLDEDSTHELVVDVGAVTFIDSTGIGALVRLQNLAERNGKQFVLANVPSRVAQVIEISGLRQFFLIRTDEPAPASLS